MHSQSHQHHMKIFCLFMLRYVKCDDNYDDFDDDDYDGDYDHFDGDPSP